MRITEPSPGCNLPGDVPNHTGAITRRGCIGCKIIDPGNIPFPLVTILSICNHRTRSRSTIPGVGIGITWLFDIFIVELAF